MEVVRGTDAYRVYFVHAKKVVVVRKDVLYPVLPSKLSRSRFVNVAHGNDRDIFNIPVPRQVFASRDAAGTDNTNINCLCHE